MKQSTKTLVLGAALAGLFAGTAARATEGSKSAMDSVKAMKVADGTEKHSCKGENSCEGKGGCKTGDNGCKGKNSCKGKGGCSTMDS